MSCAFCTARRTPPIKAFDLKIPLPPIGSLRRERGDTLRVATSDTETHLNLTLDRDRLCLAPNEALQLRDAISAAYPTPTFSKITKGDTVTVSLTVTKVDTRSCGTTMFSTDCPEWFEAHDAIGYVAPPKPKIEAGQLRAFTSAKHRYIILATPLDADNVVACRYATDGQPVLLNRREVEAAPVITP
jgi:hypothetical protein